MRSLFRPSLFALVALGLAGGNVAGASPAAAPSTRPAEAVVALLRSRAGALAPTGAIASFETDRALLRPIFAMAEATTSAEVALPARASGAVVLRDRASQMAISFALEGARDVLPEIADGLVVYPNALGDRAHLVHAVGASGTEDLVLLDEARPLTYRVELTSGVAGLRLVENVLELVDAEGAPRLRLTAPWMRAGAESIALNVETDCAHDENAAAPWHRPVVAPGSSGCRVTVRPSRDVSGPVVVDPMWQTTGDMALPRAGFVMLPLTSGSVLAAGGATTGDVVTATAELYDPASRTWAATGTMKRTRVNFAAVSLSDDTVLAVAGLPIMSTLRTSERYDPANGTWGNEVSMKKVHQYFTANLLPSGHVVAVGGLDDSGEGNNTIETFDPQANTWTLSSATLNTPRQMHTATLLPNGELIIAGGRDGDGAISDSVEQYDEANGTMRVTSLAIARFGHLAGLGSDGRLLVAGGTTEGAFASKVAETFDSGTGVWTTAPALAQAFVFGSGASLPSGCFVVSGGTTDGFSAGLKFAQAFDFRKNRWASLPALAEGRSNDAALALDATRVLVAGGQSGSSYVGDAEVLTMSANGDACGDGCECSSGLCVDGKCCQGAGDIGAKCDNECECTSGFCVDGVCCNKACDGTCEACTAKGKGSGADGTCGMTAAESDPRMDCKAEAVSTCGTTGSCDGHGACTRYKDETVCTAPICRTHQLVNSACKGGSCDETLTDCSPFACDPAGCLTSCKNIDDCADGFVCTSQHACIPTPANNPSESGGCCGVAGRGVDEGWYAALLPAALALASARRRRDGARRRRRRAA